MHLASTSTMVKRVFCVVIPLFAAILVWPSEPLQFEADGCTISFA